MGQGCLAVLLTGFLVVGCLMLIPKKPDPRTVEINHTLEAKRPECERNLARLLQNGTVSKLRETGDTGVLAGVTAFYDEQVWNRLEYDDRVRQGLLVYCAKRPAGAEHYTVLLRSKHDGHDLGSVADGNWMP